MSSASSQEAGLPKASVPISPFSPEGQPFPIPKRLCGQPSGRGNRTRPWKAYCACPLHLLFPMGHTSAMTQPWKLLVAILQPCEGKSGGAQATPSPRNRVTECCSRHWSPGPAGHNPALDWSVVSPSHFFTHAAWGQVCLKSPCSPHFQMLLNALSFPQIVCP